VEIDKGGYGMKRFTFHGKCTLKSSFSEGCRSLLTLNGWYIHVEIKGH